MAAIRRLSDLRRRYAVSRPDSFGALVPEANFGVCSSRHDVFREPAQLQHCCGSVKGFGRADEDVEYQSRFFNNWSSSLSAVGPTFSFEFGRRVSESSRWAGLVFPCRHLAVKAKKAKSKVETLDVTEDLPDTARANSVKMMETALDVLSREHSKLRTGRASAGMLDHITVEAHGVRTPLNHIAAVTVSGLQTLNVLPYDASMVKDVEKAILNSPMGLNPQVDGATMTVPLPRLTKEHCETMCKLVTKAGESAKLTIRRARKEALDVVKNSGDLSKDQMKRFEKEVDELTKKYTKSIDETCKNKEKEIMA